MYLSIKKLFSILSYKQIKNLCILICLSIFNIFFELLSISLLIPLINSFSANENSTNNIYEKIGMDFDFFKNLNFESVILFLFLLYFIKFAFSIFYSYFKNNFFFDFQFSLMHRLFREYIIRKYQFHIGTNTAKLLKDFLEEIHHVSIGFLGSFINIVTETLIIIFFILFLFYIQTSYTAFIIILTGFIALIVMSFLKKKISNLGYLREKYNFKNLKNLNQALGGIKEIKIFQKQKEIIGSYFDNSKKLTDTNWLISFYNEVPKIFFEFISLVTFLIILTVFVNLNYTFLEIISYFIIIFAIFLRLMPSVNKLIINYVNITINKNAVEILYKELIQDNTPKDEVNTKKIDHFNFRNEIVFNNVSFKFDENSENVFENLNIKIKKNTIFGLIGETGSGKSTFLDLLIGLLEPTKGQILCDNVDIKNNITGWIKKIGYVPQNMYFNDDSIIKNIAFTKNEKLIDIKSIITSAKKSNIYNMMLERGGENLDFNIGERGGKLSGGQKQRLSLARALYKINSEILVLDEFTSALDRKTEDIILTEISKLKSEKTIIISTHNKNLLQYCDEIFDITKKKSY